MRTMYDATHATVGSIPPDAAMVAGYVSDHTATQSILWTPSDWARFPHARQVRITGAPSIAADVLDMENGAAAYADAPAWLRRQLFGGRTLYFSVSAWPTVRDVLAQAGIAPATVPKWVAWYNGVASLDDVPTYPGCGDISFVVAKQYADPPLSGNSYDLSVVVDYWPGVDPAPLPPPAPLEEDSTMLVVVATKDSQGNPTGAYALNPDNGAFGGISSEDNDAARALPHFTMTDDEFNKLASGGEQHPGG